MATIDELRKMARDLYARARASYNPFTKRKLIKLADDYLQEAEVMRLNQGGGGQLIGGRVGTASHIKPRQLTSAGRKLSWVR